MTSLPPELILDILSRLPVKSLCRFKCVSKSWLNLINDPRFVKMHLKRTQRQRLFIAHKFLYNVDLETITYDDDKVVAVEDDSLGWKSINVESPCWPSNHYHRQLPKWINFIGSCNGLLCLEVFNHILLYNPSTKERKQIPKFHSVTRKLRGFGYVESVDDYKFVEIDYWGKCVAVYSLRNDSWTSFEIDRYLIDTNNVEGIFINGAIHWLVDIEGRMEILAFDLVEKKFEILPPPDIDRVFSDAYFIGLLGGCLCFSMQGNESCGEVWVMKEYGLKGSWTKIMIIPNVFYELKPLCYLNTSDKMLLFMNAQRLVFRNAKDGNLKNIEVDGDEMDDIDADDADWRDINMYVESLVSPCCKRYVQSEVLEDWFLVEGYEERRVLKT